MSPQAKGDTVHGSMGRREGTQEGTQAVCQGVGPSPRKGGASVTARPGDWVRSSVLRPLCFLDQL